MYLIICYKFFFHNYHFFYIFKIFILNYLLNYYLIKNPTILTFSSSGATLVSILLFIEKEYFLGSLYLILVNLIAGTVLLNLYENPLNLIELKFI